MPELPEVETVRRGLQPAFEDAVIERVELRRPDLRFPLPTDMPARLAGQRVVGVGRRAKYLLLHTAGAPALICHLGMTGSFRIESEDDRVTPGEFRYERSKDGVHDHVVFHLRRPNTEALRVVFNDPRRFGFMLFANSEGGHAMLDGLGVEPTGNALDGALLARLFEGRAAPLKAALLDQKLIAGLGNIYVSEALWRAGLSPRRAAGTIASKSGRPTQRAERLAVAVRDVIADAIEAGGSSLRDYMHVDGSLGYFQHRFSVYDREGEACRKPGCNGIIHRIVQSGRSTFFCPVCQR
jgi:formamidopyrimidine-DNA glycosylase